jgi:3D (Asp-Asp-Asp) domain-containing protein
MATSSTSLREMLATRLTDTVTYKMRVAFGGIAPGYPLSNVSLVAIDATVIVLVSIGHVTTSY